VDGADACTSGTVHCLSGGLQCVANPPAETCNAVDDDCNGVVDDPPVCVRRVFITSTVFTSDLGGLEGADATCQNLADAAALDGTFKAWLSSSTVAAKDRISESPTSCWMGASSPTTGPNLRATITNARSISPNSSARLRSPFPATRPW